MKISLFSSSLAFAGIIFVEVSAPISIAYAQTYQCSSNAATTYSQSPCTDGTSTQAKTASGKIPDADYQETLKRNKKNEVALKKLEDARHKDEARREKEMKAIASKNEKAAQKCVGLRASEKWAKEELTNAAPKAEKKARIKYKRATEKTALYCKAS